MLFCWNLYISLKYEITNCFASFQKTDHMGHIVNCCRCHRGKDTRTDTQENAGVQRQMLIAWVPSCRHHHLWLSPPWTTHIRVEGSTGLRKHVCLCVCVCVILVKDNKYKIAHQKSQWLSIASGGTSELALIIYNNRHFHR